MIGSGKSNFGLPATNKKFEKMRVGYDLLQTSDLFFSIIV